jgi:hypothetical protein
MSNDEAFDRLHDATRSLARDGHIKERLLEAWSKYLSELDADALPQELRATYMDEQRALQSIRPLPGESALRASVRKMSSAEASQHAVCVADLFAQLARSRAMLPSSAAAARRASQRAVQAPVPAVVELFAAES